MAKKTEIFDYGTKAAALEALLVKLQAEDIQIDEATKLHAEGMKLVAELEAYLKSAETVVRTHKAA